MASRVRFARHERVFQGDSEDKKGDQANKFHSLFDTTEIASGRGSLRELSILRFSHSFMDTITVEPPLTATSLQRPLYCVPADSPYSDSNLYTTPSSTQRQEPLQRVSNCQNNISTTASFFSDWWESQEWSSNWSVRRVDYFDFVLLYTLLQ